MKNSRWIIVFDFETDSPNEETCNPVELAAVPIDPETLEIKEAQAFNAIITPPGIGKDDYFTPEREKTINWHADTRGVSYDDIIDRWKGGVSQKIAWKNFCGYCNKYMVDKKPGQWFPQPIAAGYNIVGFDLPIAQRMCKKHKTKFPFSKTTKLDMMDNLFWWFENLEEPHDFKMDTWRKFFKMEANGQAHEALTDVIDEGKMIVKFLQFHRKQASIKKFKGAMAGV